MTEVSVQSGLAPALAELGFGAEIIHQHDGPRVTRHTVRLADAEDFGKLERRLDDLAFTLGLKDVGVFMAAAGSPNRVAGCAAPPSAWKSQGAETLSMAIPRRFARSAGRGCGG